MKRIATIGTRLFGFKQPKIDPPPVDVPPGMYAVTEELHQHQSVGGAVPWIVLDNLRTKDRFYMHPGAWEPALRDYRARLESF